MELPPPGWRWDGGWKIQPERSCTFEPEEGLNEWTEEIFENQTRKFLSHWPDESKSYWTDLVIKIWWGIKIQWCGSLTAQLSICMPY